MFGKVPFGVFGFDPPGEHSIVITGTVTEVVRRPRLLGLFSRAPYAVISFDEEAHEEAHTFFQRNGACAPTQVIEIFWNEKGRWSLPTINDRVRVTFSCPGQNTAWVNEVCLGLSNSRIIRNFEILLSPT